MRGNPIIVKEQLLKEIQNIVDTTITYKTYAKKLAEAYQECAEQFEETYQAVDGMEYWMNNLPTDAYADESLVDEIKTKLIKVNKLIKKLEQMGLQ